MVRFLSIRFITACKCSPSCLRRRILLMIPGLSDQYKQPNTKLLCFVCVCFVKLDLLKNFYPHWPHSNNNSLLLCLLSCFCRWNLLPNDLLQIEQSNFSLLWSVRWRMRTFFWAYDLPQISQTCCCRKLILEASVIYILIVTLCLVLPTQ